MSHPQKPDVAQLKQEAAERAVKLIQPGMIVGLGTGSTTLFAIRRIAQLYQAGGLSGILGIPTSVGSEREARRLGIPLTTLAEHPHIDLTIDGADEVDPQLNLIKGLGGALLREKIVALASRREVIIVDESKLSQQLGSLAPLPVEVVPFAWQLTADFLESLGAKAKMRLQPDGSPYHTDQGNFILDCSFGPLERLAELASRLKARTGVVEHGLFLGLATDVIVAGPGGVRQLVKEQ